MTWGCVFWYLLTLYQVIEWLYNCQRRKVDLWALRTIFGNHDRVLYDSQNETPSGLGGSTSFIRGLGGLLDAQAHATANNSQLAT